MLFFFFFWKEVGSLLEAWRLNCKRINCKSLEHFCGLFNSLLFAINLESISLQFRPSFDSLDRKRLWPPLFRGWGAPWLLLGQLSFKSHAVTVMSDPSSVAEPIHARETCSFMPCDFCLRFIVFAAAHHVEFCVWSGYPVSDTQRSSYTQASHLSVCDCHVDAVMVPSRNAFLDVCHVTV